VAGLLLLRLDQHQRHSSMMQHPLGQEFVFF
jgi:hypothetical protein